MTRPLLNIAFQWLFAGIGGYGRGFLGGKLWDSVFRTQLGALQGCWSCEGGFVITFNFETQSLCSRITFVSSWFKQKHFQNN